MQGPELLYIVFAALAAVAIFFGAIVVHQDRKEKEHSAK